MKALSVIQGKVVRNKRRGSRIGFPTINILLKKVIPEGIYISITNFSGKKYHSLTFIGPALTYSETDYKSETYILDFNQEIYGKDVSIALVKKIRENQKFASEDELIKQMEEDKKEAEDFFKLL